MGSSFMWETVFATAPLLGRSLANTSQHQEGSKAPKYVVSRASALGSIDYGLDYTS